MRDRIPSSAGLDTRAVHAGDPRPRIEGSLTVPVFQSSVFEHSDEESDYHAVRYPRLSNLPNHVALAGKLAALEGTETAVVAGSGMAAISATFFEVLGGGGHALLHDQLYGGTHTLVTEQFARHGIDFDFIDATGAPATWRRSLRRTTRLIYTEAITNPLMRVADHEAVIAFAREHELVSAIDATFASPINFRPAELGYDLVLHSATKYLNGHSDLVAGAVAGPASWIERIQHQLNHVGGALDPHACFLLARGMKTLGLRVRRQNATALALARELDGHPAIEQVNHPGLEGHPDHRRARQLLDGFGGMLSFVPGGGVAAARRLLERLELPVVGPSLGGCETLVTRPVTTSHAGLQPDERRRLGIDDALVRVSVGIEDEADVLEDFARALA